MAQASQQRSSSSKFDPIGFVFGDAPSEASKISAAGRWVFAQQRGWPSDPIVALVSEPPPKDIVWVGGQRFRAIDNGHANTLAPVDGPWDADRRKAVERISLMADGPFASIAYLAASAADQPEPVKDLVLAGGGALDTVLSGLAPAGIRPKFRPQAPRPSVAPVPLQQDRVTFGRPREAGQPSYMKAWVSPGSLAMGSRVGRRTNPAGWAEARARPDYRDSDGRPAWSRMHLLAKSLGGRGEDIRNLVPGRQNPTNGKHMWGFEREVLRKVKEGEVFEYFVQPVYSKNSLMPDYIFMLAVGSRGSKYVKIINNPK